MKDHLIDPFDPSFEPIEIELGPNGELPPGFEYLPRARSFRAFLAQHGVDRPFPESAPGDWVAWYLDAHWEDDVSTYDVTAGPVEEEWPA